MNGERSGLGRLRLHRQALVEALRRRGDAVRVFDLTQGQMPGVEYVRASVDHQATVEAALDGVDCLYHLAGIAHLWRRDKGDFDRVELLRSVIPRCEGWQEHRGR